MKIATVELLVEMMPELEVTLRARLAHRVLNLGARFDMDDVIQTIWQKCFMYIDSCNAKTTEDFRRWVLVTGRNAVESMVTAERGAVNRSTRREECAIGVSIDGEGDGYQPAARTVDPSVQAEISEECDRMMEVVNTLPKAMKACVIGRYIEQKSNEEVAAELGCMAETVRSMASKGIALVRKMMNGEVETKPATKTEKKPYVDYCPCG